LKGYRVGVAVYHNADEYMKLHSRAFRLPAYSVMFFMTAGTSRAVLTVYDGFDYAASADMNNLSGGTGWGTAAWTGTAGTRQIQSPGSNYASIPTVGNKAYLQASTAGIVRLLPGLQGGGDGTLWISFIAQRDPATQVDPDRFFSMTFYQGGTASANERFSIGEPSSNNNNVWGMYFTSSVSNRQEIAGDSIYTQSFLLARIDYHGDTTVNDDIYLWGNYNISSGEPDKTNAPAKFIGTAPTGYNLAFDRLALRAGAASGTLPNAQGFFDELRIGTTFADVTGNAIVCGLGDVNCDGHVDLANDFEAIRVNFRKTVTMRSQGDLTGDNVVNFNDFGQWKSAFVAVGGSLAGIDFLQESVPEPSSLVLLMPAMIGIARHRFTCRWLGG
jgi:hypothetical protein